MSFLVSKFNEPVTNTTTNLAGGSAYKESPELELVSALLTSFLEDKFYEKGKDRQKRIIECLDKVTSKFAAQATLYARNEYGMRSVSHVAAAELADKVKGEAWAQRFYDKVIHRPDDITEIMAYYKQRTSKKESHAMRKGFAHALQRFDDYQLAKYRGEGKRFSMLDAVFLTHPKPTGSIEKLVNDKLRNEHTFEAKISEAGQKSSKTTKQEAWSDIVKSGRLGYFALLKNLRNIVQEAPEVIDEACSQLTNAKKIRNSLVLPFRLLTAADEVSKLQGPEAKKALIALNQAMDISVENIPRFDGETLVAVDKSGSMQSTTIVHASLFAAMVVKSNGADVILWDDHAQHLTLNPMDSTLTLATQIQQTAVQRMGGTDIAAPFLAAKRKYNRILLLTDNQSWMQSHTGYYWGAPTMTGPQALAQYKKTTGADPFVYNWDLQGYGTLQFPERNTATLAGWSDKVFDIMKMVETDKRALIKQIASIEL